MADSIRGYRLLAPLATAGGGQSQWTFAERGGREYFVKQFLAPTYPMDSGPGSPATKARKREVCQRFEAHHALIRQKLSPLSKDGGNLVVTKDFFREQAHYFKVTEKVEVSATGPAELARLPLDKLLVLMLSVTHSLRILHTNQLVHGDVKPENILLKALAKEGHYTCKLIDFDNCFVVGDPPRPADVVGDPAYYSPELMQYVSDQEPAVLDARSDVFALGLVFAEYASGAPPVIVGDSGYPAESLSGSGRLAVPASVDPGVAELVSSMVRPEPAERPGINEVFASLKLLQRGGARTAGPVGSRRYGTRPPADGGASEGRLSGTLITRDLGAGGAAVEDDPGDGAGDAEVPGSRLKGTLIRKKAPGPA